MKKHEGVEPKGKASSAYQSFKNIYNKVVEQIYIYKTQFVFKLSIYHHQGVCFRAPV